MLVDTLLSELIKYFSRGWISNHLLVMLLITFIYKLPFLSVYPVASLSLYLVHPCTYVQPCMLIECV